MVNENLTAEEITQSSHEGPRGNGHRDIHAAVRDYVARGWSPSRLDPGKKHNTDEDFLTREYPPECFGPFDNVAIRTGVKSGRIADIDIDDSLVAEVMPRFLPDDAPRFGRDGNPSSHYLVRVTGEGPIPTFKFAIHKGVVLAELRGDGAQTMVPPSVHPSGEIVRWEQDGNPPTIAYDELKRSIGKASLTAILIERWRGPAGGRHDLMLAMAAFLLQAEWTQEEIEAIFRAVHERVCPGRLSESLRAIRGTAERLDNDEPIMSEAELRDALGTTAVRNLKKWFGISKRKPWVSGPDDEQFTSLGLAQRFARLCHDRTRYGPAWKQWLLWDGTRWKKDDSHAVDRLMIDVIKDIYREGFNETNRARGQALIKWALENETNRRIEEALALAAKLAPLQVGIEELDADPELLNCLNGTVNLRTGELYAHDPADLITKRVPFAYNPTATCRRWESFNRQIMGEGFGKNAKEVEERVTYLQRVLGYTVSGETIEQLWFYLFGKGRNGKSTLLETVAEILGPDDYSLKVPVEMLLIPKGSDRHPTDEADVPGRRFVFTSEMPKGRHLDVARVKDLTGGDQRATRHMREDFFRYVPVAAFFAYGNTLPEVKGGDDGFWERLRLIVFEAQFLNEKRNKRLREELRQEAEGILAWLVQGAMDWYEHGLAEPKDFATAAASYRSGMDPLAEFFEEYCEEGPRFSVPFKDLFAAYAAWASVANERNPLGSRAFGNELTERGYARGEGHARQAIRWGLRLKKEKEELLRQANLL